MPVHAGWPTHRPRRGFNPLFLYGGVGLGKTHLMHSIAWELTNPDAGRAAATVAYMSAEKFMYRFIGAIRSQSTIEFKDQLRSVDVLMIDDLQFLIGKDNTQEEFFHTFNALVDAGRQIVVSADKSPADLSGSGRPAAHAAGLRHGGRPACHHLRIAAVDPGGQGRARQPWRCRAGSSSSWPAGSSATCASWKAPSTV